MSEKTGVLLLNLGTPRAPDTKSVRAYLKEFLSDPFVLDMPWLLRMLLLYGVILPFRPKQSSHAYQQIWLPEGSPLLVYSQQFSVALGEALGDAYQVVLGMRYGHPTIKNAVEQLYDTGCRRVIVFPLFPQYARSATGSALKAAERAFEKYPNHFKLYFQRSFYHDVFYQEALNNVLRPQIKAFQPDYILLSYHGLPERQLTKVGCSTSNCNRVDSCLLQRIEAEDCYRAQCFVTTEAIATRLSLKHEEYQTVFQSRLGRAQWIRPYTDQAIHTLLARGVKRLMVVCPSFVADCLETLEEVGLRLREQWLSAGGDAFYLAPSLNTEPAWVQAVKTMVLQAENGAHH